MASHWVVCWVVLMGSSLAVASVDVMDAKWVVAKDAWSAVQWVDQRVDEKDVMTAALSVDSKESR